MKSFRTKLFRNQHGFTLVEMAIVLIIIGIILGAVLKGQDLITNARAKKLTTTMNSWSVNAFTFMDRMGRFPGDSLRNGIIGDVAGEQAPLLTAIGEMTDSLNVNAMTGAPQNPIQIGGQSFWIYFGNIPTVGATRKNAMVVCGSATCNTALSNDAIQILQAVDTATDGVAGAGVGQIRAITAATITGQGPIPVANGGRETGTLTAATIAGAAALRLTAAGDPNALWAITQRGAIWLFDKPF